MNNLLQKTKNLYQDKPWQYMGDDQTFLIVNSHSGEYYYCSVIGAAGETFGLAVYIGQEGLLTLLKVLKGGEPDFDFLLKQRSILLTFENREDLSKEDYQFVKNSDVTFRGKKAWPVFISYQPGYYPWFVDTSEMAALETVLEQALEICREVKAGTALPNFIKDGEIFARVYKDNGYQNEVVPLNHFKLEGKKLEVPLEVSEFDLKRAKKIKQVYQVAVEFSVFHVDMPVQEDPGERPMFPLMIVAADHEKGFIFYQDLVSNNKDYGTIQAHLLKAFQGIEGIPELILMDTSTAAIMQSVTEKMGLNVEIQEKLEAIEEFYNQLVEDLDMGF
ncbi:DUF7309 domain-containing protein [Virgibacillus sp. DJP39]|uniref:DUF7309 domain-containing protein n=1 Tax=Virgibacillus sp. DJP39 TaxID=3409790 RepID=UPI003BB70A9F